MKSLLLALTVTVVSLWSLGAMASPSRAKNFPLVCKSGTTFQVEYRSVGVLVGHKAGPIVLITFKKGRGPESAGLNPGECTWTDRALRPSEPLMLGVSSPGRTTLIFQGSTLVSSSFANLPWASGLLSGNGRIYVFQVHDYHDLWVIDRAGP